MDRNAIERFSVNARIKLRRSVEASMAGLGFGEGCEPLSIDTSGDTIVLNLPAGLQRTLTRRENEWRNGLLEAVSREGYDNIVEQVAYTWFNRLIAIRYMEVNDYLPTHVRVLSSTDPGKREPDLVTQCIRMSDILGTTSEEKDEIIDLKDRNRSDELFSKMFLYECRSLHAILPELFGETRPYEKLLINLSYTVQDGVVRELVDTVPEEDFRDAVQIIGWMYQYYNSELKDEVFSDLKKNVKISKERIPAATQLFTPDWIVRYMVENSLGRVWLEGHPDDSLRSEWRYYLDEAEQEPQVAEALKRLREPRRRMEPSDIRIIDPCMGSGHVLVYAFDVLMQIYESYGYSKADAVSSILDNNIFGLDIDERAYQLAYFAVMMKARGYDPNIFGKGLKPNLHAILETSAMDESCLEGFGNGMPPAEKDSALNDMRYLIDAFRDARTYGSLIKIKELDFGRIAEFLKARSINIYARENVLDEIAAIAKVLSEKYDAVITNPPYMGASGMNCILAKFVKDDYPLSKSDLSTCFMERTLLLCKDDGFSSMINIPVWMFLSSFEKMRKSFSKTKTYINMAHQGRGIFGSDFGSTAFVIQNRPIQDYISTFVKLYDKQGAVDSVDVKESKFLSGENRFYVKQSRFDAIPGAPIIYWFPQIIYDIFIKNKNIKDICPARRGIETGNNDLFLRNWWEVSLNSISIETKDYGDFTLDNYKWFPYNKGGNFKTWYGNRNLIVNFHKRGIDIINDSIKYNHSCNVDNATDVFFHKGITWTALTSSKNSFRYSPEGSLFDSNKGPMMFPDEALIFYILGLLNSPVAHYILSSLNPTLSLQNRDVNLFPIIINNHIIPQIDRNVRHIIEIVHREYDNSELSWNFNSFLTKDYSLLLSDVINKHIEKQKNNQEIVLNLLEENNRLIIDSYALSNYLNSNPEVIDSSIIVNSTFDVVKQLLSYAVGCMFGRYSLERDGLVNAGGEWIDVGLSFEADPDNILPINDNEYFGGDIVVRFVEFIKVAFGEDHLEGNLKFIADNLGIKNTGTARDGIRKYFLNNFYDDHVRMYQKRPIYWLFDSGKENGFKALIYMHRYTPDLISKMRQDYLLPMLSRYTEQLNSVDEVTKMSIQKKIAEIQIYDIAMEKYASEKVSIDLDDGVKVNYAKFQNIENPGSRKRIDLLHPLK